MCAPTFPPVCLFSCLFMTILIFGCIQVLVWPLFALVPPYVCACSFSFHLSLVALSCTRSCLFSACSCLFAFVWAHLSVSNTQLVHIIIKKLTMVIYIINLDDIWLVFYICRTITYSVFEVGCEWRGRECMVRSAWPIEPCLAPSRCDTVS